MRRHILHVGLEAPQVRRGGLNRYLQSLREAQNDATETSVVWLDPAGRSDDWHVIPVTSQGWFARLRRFSSAIRESDAEVIDVHFAAHAAWAVASGALRRRPLVVHFQGPWADESAWTGDASWSVRLKRTLERFVLRRADAVVVLSEAFRRIAISTYGVAPQRVHIIAPGFPEALHRDRAAARAKLGLDSREHIAIMVRRLVPRMGHEVAFAALRDCPEWRVFVVGEGPHEARLREFAQQCGITDRVTFWGGVDDETLANLFAASDVSLVPSLAHEGFGLVVLESIAAGTPVLASDLDGLRDAARLSNAVELVPPGDVDAWCHALRRWVAPAFDIAADVRRRPWSVVAHEHDALYESLVRGVLTPKLAVFLDHTAKPSGGELAMARLISGLSTQWHAHVLLGAAGPLEDTLREAGASVEIDSLGDVGAVARDALHVHFIRNVWSTARYVRRLRRRLVQLAPDVVHANSLKAVVYATAAVWGTSLPLVVHVRDRWSPPYMSKGARGVLRAIVRLRSDMALANSSSTGTEVPGCVEIVPSPVATEFFEVPFPTSPPITIAVVGRFAPWKGQDFAIRVASNLRREISWRWIFIGDALFGEDEFRERVERAASASPCAERISFHGNVDDVATQLAGVDIVVLTSQSPEPFGNVVTEAMAAGRAVVVPNEGGPTEYVEPERSGLWYLARDVDSCAQAINRLLENDDLRLGLGSVAARQAATFGVVQVAARVEALYDEVVTT